MAEVLTGTVLAIIFGALITLRCMRLMLSMQRRILRNQLDMLDYLASQGCSKTRQHQ
jgi:hypothetical protein